MSTQRSAARTLVLVLACVLSPCLVHSASGQQRVFGINAYGHGSNFPDYGPPSQLQANAGVEWSRVAFNWFNIQPDGPGAPNPPVFSFTDTVVSSLTSRGIEVVGVLGGPPRWASTAPSDPFYFLYPPSDLDEWEAYVRATVDHYKDVVDYWEVWNEPNYDLAWRPAANVNAYNALLVRTWNAIKGPTGEDPNAKIVLGGLSGVDLNFLQNLVNLGAWNRIDVVAVHPYDFASPPEYFGRVDNLLRLRAFVAANGNKPIWYTEAAWPSEPYQSNPPISRARQADFLVRDYVQAIGLGAERYAWWNLREDAVNPGDLYSNTGLLQLDMTPKPAYTAYATMTDELSGLPFRRRRNPYRQTLATGFESADPWTVIPWQGSNGSFARNGSVKLSGNYSGSLGYAFPTPGVGSLLILQREFPLAGSPRRFSVWVKGDNGDHRLSIQFKDAGGEVFRLKLGHTIGTEWRQLTGTVEDATSPFGGDGTINYPIRFYQFYLENFQIPEFPSFGHPSGTIYLDELSYDQGDAHVHDYQFGGGGSYVDVVWTTDGGVTRAIPFPTNSVTITTVNGSVSVVNDGGAGDLDGVANLITTIGATDSPRFVRWQGKSAYVLDDYGGIHPGGAAIGEVFNTPYFGFDVAVDLEFVDGQSSAYYLLDGFGGIHAGGGAPPAPGAPYYGFHIGRDIEIAPGGTGVYQLDGYGGIHRAGGAPALPGPLTPYFGFDVARDLEFVTTGYYVVDGFGGVHAGGGAPNLNPKTPYFGFDIVADIEIIGGGYYLLDGYGGVHRGGAAPPLSPPPPYFGFDIAVDLELSDVGVYVLDAFGGVHPGGGAPYFGMSPDYFGFDFARDLEIR